jgi:uncharacterized protein
MERGPTEPVQPTEPTRPAAPVQRVHRGAIAAACLGAALPILAIAGLLVVHVAKRAAPAAPPAALTYGPPVPDRRPRIALVIDDAGIDAERSARAIRLRPGVTISFLPYAPSVRQQIAAAREAGHEVLAHVPMQPLDGRHDPGPNTLVVGQSREELRRALDASLRLVPPVVGINNHMGSRFTGDRAGMDALFAELAQRGLLFLDSRTVEHTVARASARAHGVPYAQRDVFLDHIEKPDAVRRQLELLERQAREHGVAVGIGHPRDVTLQALEQWLPALEARGFAIVPVSAVVQRLPAVQPVASSPVGAKAR